MRIFIATLLEHISCIIWDCIYACSSYLCKTGRRAGQIYTTTYA